MNQLPLFDIKDIADAQLCSLPSEVSEALDAFTPRPKIVSAVAEVPGERWLLQDKDDRCFRVFRTGGRVEVREGEPRHYASTKLPTFAGGINAKPEVLLALYEQVGSSWRHLTDIRFKVLGLLPAVSVVMWGQLLTASSSATRLGASAAVVLSAIGACLAFFLYRYDQRNTELYNDLISRGRKIEEQLGVDTGVFRGRRKPMPCGPSHGKATAPLYRLTIAGWLLVLLWFFAIASGLFSIAAPAKLSANTELQPTPVSAVDLRQTPQRCV